MLMSRFAVAAVVVAQLAASAVGIYPADHFEHSTKLTQATAEDFVKENVDQGKTVFVRWIASAG